MSQTGSSPPEAWITSAISASQVVFVLSHISFCGLVSSADSASSSYNPRAYPWPLRPLLASPRPTRYHDISLHSPTATRGLSFPNLLGTSLAQSFQSKPHRSWPVSTEGSSLDLVPHLGLLAEAGRARKQVMQKQPAPLLSMGGDMKRQAYNHINDKVHTFKSTNQRQSKIIAELAKGQILTQSI